MNIITGSKRGFRKTSREIRTLNVSSKQFLQPLSRIICAKFPEPYACRNEPRFTIEKQRAAPVFCSNIDGCRFHKFVFFDTINFLSLILFLLMTLGAALIILDCKVFPSIIFSAYSRVLLYCAEQFDERESGKAFFIAQFDYFNFHASFRSRGLYRRTISSKIGCGDEKLTESKLILSQVYK